MNIRLTPSDYEEAIRRLTLTSVRWEDVLREATSLAAMRAMDANIAAQRAMVDKLHTLSGLEWMRAQEEITRLFDEYEQISVIAFGDVRFER